MTIDLSVERIDGAQPQRAVAFLHGILGRGSNLRATARQFLERRPTWTAWLVDLRGHGQSPKGSPDPSLESAARDVVALAARDAIPLSAVIGHSFGGKVALEVARLGEIDSLRHVVVIDSMPGAREPIRGGDSALAVLEMLQSLPPVFASITEFSRTVEAAGFARELAQWLAGSLDREGNQVRFALDLREIRSLLLDYFARDFWPIVEHPPGALRVHLVIGDRSDSYSPADRDRAARAAASNPQVTVDVLPAGHWVHVEDPSGLVRTLGQHLAE
jgi:esterase